MWLVCHSRQELPSHSVTAMTFVIAAVAIAAVAGTIYAVASDGYHRVPTPPTERLAASSVGAMTWLVTGGAGYIGAHVVRALDDADIETVVLDDLSTGHESFVPDGVPFVRGSILDGELLVEYLRSDHDVTGVIHVAGFKYAGVSVHAAAAHLRAERHRHGDAARGDAVPRRRPHRVLVERGRLRHARRRPRHRADARRPGVALRRVEAHRRVAARRPGASPRACATRPCATSTSSAPAIPTLYDSSPHNLFPLVFDALLEGSTPRINGDDYPTPDGTNVRDYIHVADLAHLARRRCPAARRRRAGRAGLQPRQR